MTSTNAAIPLRMNASQTLDYRDAAEYILEQFDAPLSTMKLQKLLYFAQGWTLAIVNRRLVNTDFEAWKWGPVSHELYTHHRRQYGIEHLVGGDASTVTGNNKVILDAVIENYGGLSGMQLGDLTHQPGTPWTTVRQEAGITDNRAPSKISIPDELIREHFAKILHITDHKG